MENSSNQLYFFVKLKKNYSKQNVIKGQHFRLVCDHMQGEELTYEEKLALLNKDEECVIDPEKYDENHIPFSNALVDCTDLEDITKEVLEKGSLFFTDSSFFGDKDGREEIEREEKELMDYVDNMYEDLSEDTDLEADESVNE